MQLVNQYKNNYKKRFDKIYNSRFTKILGFIALCADIIGLIIVTVIFIISLFPEQKYNLNGSWFLTDIVKESINDHYNNYILKFYLSIQQTDNKIKGEGEKISENNKNILRSERIQLTFEGNIINDNVTIKYHEMGKLSETIGTINLKILENGKKLIGNFTSTAADSKGTSEMIRVK